MPQEWISARSRWLIGSAALVAVATLATFAVVAARAESDPVPGSEPAPVQTVREFLTALNQKDPQRALEIAGVADPPSGEPARLLRPEAMSGEWTVRDITQIESSGLTGEATVRVTIAGPDGDAADFRVRLTETNGSWVLSDPFARVMFAAGPLWYLEVNDYRTPVDADVPSQEYLVLPGFYRFYPEPPPGVEADFAPVLLVPGSYHVATPQELRLTEVGEVAIQRAVETYVDACAGSPELAPHACPFGSTTYSQLPGYSIHWDYGTEVQWTVLEYPVVAAAPRGSIFLIADRQRGLIRLRATVRSVEVYGEPGGDPASGLPAAGSVASVVCEIDSGQLAAAFTADREVAIVTSFGRHSFPDPPAPREKVETETCQYVSLAS